MYQVRDAEMRDVYVLADIIKRVLDESITYSHLTFDRDKTANFLVDGIKKRKGTFLRIIVDETDTPVGGLMGWVQEPVTSRDIVADDITMMVDVEHRGKCIKQFLQVIMEYKDWAVSENAKLIKIGISSGMKVDSASRFLEKLGFERVGAVHAFRVGV